MGKVTIILIAVNAAVLAAIVAISKLFGETPQEKADVHRARAIALSNALKRG